MIKAVFSLAMVFFSVGGMSLLARAASPAEQPQDAQRLMVADRVAALAQADWIAEDLRFGLDGDALASDGPVTTAQDAAGAVDGVTNSRFGFHTASNEIDPWWQVDLTRITPIERVVVYNRTDGSTAPRTSHLRILVAEQGAGECTPQDFRLVYQHDGGVFYGAAESAPLVVTFDKPIEARVVRLMVPGKCSLALVEVQIYAAGDPDTNIALGKPADQKSIHPTASSPGTQGYPLPESLARPAQKEASFSIDHTRQVLDRAARLVARLDGLRRIRCVWTRWPSNWPH
jgi:hypothetical protein